MLLAIFATFNPILCNLECTQHQSTHINVVVELKLRLKFIGVFYFDMTQLVVSWTFTVEPLADSDMEFVQKKLGLGKLFNSSA